MAEKKVSSKKKKRSGTVYDDGFRTMAQKLPELFIPLINEVFHTDYPEDEPLRQRRNEHLERFGKIITDSVFDIRNRRYHIECQSTLDGHMTLRMLEYDLAIALENAENSEEVLEIHLPESCVLYIRNQSNLAKSHRAKIVASNDQFLIYDIPILAAQDYTLDEIFSKHLLLLLPYYILRYEKLLKSENPERDQVEKLLADYRLILSKLREGNPPGEKIAIYQSLVEIMNHIADYSLEKNPDIQKEYQNIMGGNVLPLSTDWIRNSIRSAELKGIKDGKRESQLESVRIVADKSGISLEDAMNFLNITGEDRKYCREQLRLSGVQE